MSTKMSCHFIHLLQVYSIHFFSLFNTCTWPRDRGRQPPRGQNFDDNKKALLLYPFVASFKEMSLKSGFIQLVHDLIYVYSPGAGGIQSPGDKVLMTQKFLVTSVICC